ncbi:helix-turn-helix domain-containing protein, partial [Candidatus Kaiserbacteria bacterium]|nr:helix-turn-helix domain-containing protein [Candidatus Kaiserbacteria bacterium]
MIDIEHQTHLIDKDIEYLTVSDAARAFGYTNNYVARLVREGKVLGKRIGHQWLVARTSLEVFSADAAKQKVCRNEEIQKRLAEERRCATVSTLKALPHDETNAETLKGWLARDFFKAGFRPALRTLATLSVGATLALLPLTHPITRTQALLATTPADAYHTLASLAATAYHNARALNDRIEQ